MRIVEELGEWYDARLAGLAKDAERAASRMRAIGAMTEEQLWTLDGDEGVSQMQAIREELAALHDNFAQFEHDVERSTGVAAPDGLSKRRE